MGRVRRRSPRDEKEKEIEIRKLDQYKKMTRKELF
jgi:hypothetical protein